jgi:hypothetical protein
LRKEKGTESLFKETLTENFPDLGKETVIQMKEAYTVHAG